MLNALKDLSDKYRFSVMDLFLLTYLCDIDQPTFSYFVVFVQFGKKTPVENVVTQKSYDCKIYICSIIVPDRNIYI